MNTNTEEAKSTELVLVADTEIQLKEAFIPNGLQPVIDKIRTEARSHVPDLTTPKGRQAITAVCTMVQKSRDGIENLRKDLVSGMKAKCKIIDAEGKRCKDTLIEFQAEIRKPLTEWEEAETKRLEQIAADIQSLKDSCSTEKCYELNSYDLAESLDVVANFVVRHDENGQIQQILDVKHEAIKRINLLIEVAKKSEAEAVELEKLRKEKVERDAEEAEAQAEKDKFDAAIKNRMEFWQSECAEIEHLSSEQIKTKIGSAQATTVDDAFGKWKKEASDVLFDCINKLEDALVDAVNRELREKEMEDRELMESYRNGIDNIKGLCKFESDEPDIDQIIIASDYAQNLDIKDKYGALQNEAFDVLAKTKSFLGEILNKALEREKELKEKFDADAKKQREEEIEKAREEEREFFKTQQTKRDAAALEDKNAREADTKHRQGYDEAASGGLQSLDISEDKANEIVQAISQNLIPNVTINY